jgi:nucleotidyltransferase/DNA polymerase involved in DNA repair
MSFLCLYNLAWLAAPPATLHAPLLTIVPRVVSDGDLVWADLRGLPVRETTERVRDAFTAHSSLSSSVKCGVASTAITAEVAARYAPQSVTYVRSGYDRDFLAPFPISVLAPESRLANLLDGTGVELCRDLARLSREEVEVRFGSEGMELWRIARADDGRRIFGSMPRALPEASLEWTDYAIRRAERLVFVINALFGNVCEALRARGEGALAVTISFALANRSTIEHPIRAARATAGQTAWMRLVRLEIERIVFPDAVTGITLRVDLASGTGGRQGDVFDRGFGSESAAEEALGQLMDDQGAIAVEPENSAHPLLDRRTAWTPMSAMRVMERAHIHAAALSEVGAPALTLQLLPEPRRISVATFRRRGDEIPRAYRDRGAGTSYDIVEAAGPDRVSGGHWDDQYVRDYFRCVIEDGSLVWLYRDVHGGAWYLHGWWD